METPQHISLMTPSPSINTETILRSRIQIPGDEHAREPKEAPLVDIEIEVEGEQPLPRHGGGQGRNRASYLRGLMVFGM